MGVFTDALNSLLTKKTETKTEPVITGSSSSPFKSLPKGLNLNEPTGPASLTLKHKPITQVFQALPGAKLNPVQAPAPVKVSNLPVPAIPTEPMKSSTLPSAGNFVPQIKPVEKAQPSLIAKTTPEGEALIAKRYGNITPEQQKAEDNITKLAKSDKRVAEVNDFITTNLPGLVAPFQALAQHSTEPLKKFVKDFDETNKKKAAAYLAIGKRGATKEDLAEATMMILQVMPIGEAASMEKAIADGVKKLGKDTVNKILKEEGANGIKVLESRLKNLSADLFHGADELGNLKVDKFGNINLGTDAKDLERFGPVKNISTKGLDVREVGTKEEMFNLVSNPQEKQKLLDEGVDVLKADNHAIAINPDKVAKTSGLKLRSDQTMITVEEMIAKNGEPATILNKIKTEVDPGKQRKFIQTVLDSKTTSPELKEAVAKIEPQLYDPITNKETLAKAKEAVKDNYQKALDDVMTSQTVGADTSAKAQVLIQKAQAEGRLDDAIEILKHLDEKARQSGQFIQGLSMWDRLTPEGMLRFAQKEIEQSNDKVGFIGKQVKKLFGKEPNKLDPETAKFITDEMTKLQGVIDPEERSKIIKGVMEAINKKIPITASEMFDAYRYQNMLSSPRTQERNIYSNAFQSLITRPATMAVESGLDWVRAGITGTDRTRYLKDVPEYYKALINSVPNGLEAFKEVWKGTRQMVNPDLAQIRLEKMPKALTVVSRAMEGTDQFFRTIISAGEYAANKSRGMTDEAALEAADKTAIYSLFRNMADPKNKTEQGLVLSKIDQAIATINRATKDHPTLKWFVPFVRTPMNVAKQWIEYSPLGLTTLAGAAKKQEQLAKATLGTMALGIGAAVAMQGDTTWSVPTDPKQKELFYASGKKPFSVRIGDKWVPMIYAGPFALALALPAATKYYTQDQGKALTDSDLEKTVKILQSSLEFFSNQTFLQGFNNYIKTISGDADYSLPSSLAFSAGQVIPLQGLVRYVNTILDPVYRTAKGFKENVQKDIPGLSQNLPPKLDPKGNESTRDWVNYLIPFDIGQHVEEYDKVLKLRMEASQKRAVNVEKAGEKTVEAEKIVSGLKDMDKEAQKARLLDLKKSDKVLFDKVAKIIKDNKKTGGVEADFYKGLEVKNGMRAMFIYKEMKAITDKAELKDFLLMLQKNKILTDEVFKQIADMKAAEKLKTQ